MKLLNMYYHRSDPKRRYAFILRNDRYLLNYVRDYLGDSIHFGKIDRPTITSWANQVTVFKVPIQGKDK